MNIPRRKKRGIQSSSSKTKLYSEMMSIRVIQFMCPLENRPTACPDLLLNARKELYAQSPRVNCYAKVDLMYASPSVIKKIF